MNGLSHYNLFVGCRLVGRTDNAVDALAFFHSNLAAAVYYVYTDGTGVLWLSR